MNGLAQRDGQLRISLAQRQGEIRGRLIDGERE
jgi:hypothetical protein